MKHMRRSGYTLIYLLAALPLIAVIINVAGFVVSRALRAQRIAVAERADDVVRGSVLAQVRADASVADSVEGESDSFSGDVTFRDGSQTVEYRSENDTIARVERSGEDEVSRRSWHLKYGTCSFRIETLANERALVWLRCDVEVAVEQRLGVQRQYTTAVPVAEGGKS